MQNKSATRFMADQNFGFHPACRLSFRSVHSIANGHATKSSGSRLGRQSSSRRKYVVVCSSDASLVEKVSPEFYETEKEQSRKYRKTVFSHEDWFKHRSTSRYSRHIIGMFQSRIVRSLAWPVGFVVGVSTFLVIYETLRENQSLPPWCISLVVESSEPFNLTSFALSLLLVFRTNASYARWVDARTLWGGVVNRSRDVVRQGVTWLSPEKKDLIQMLQRWVTAFPRALKCHLTYDSDLRAELQHVLNERELDALMRSSHRPNYVTRVIAEIINTAKLTDSEVFLMDTNLSFFMDAAGGCERIFKTPIPLSWTRHTSRFLMLWLAFLPCIIYQTCHWATPIVGAVISLSLLVQNANLVEALDVMFACDEISVSLEEPFGILPLDNLCEVIEADAKEMASQRNEVEALVQQQLPLVSDSNGGTEGSPAGTFPQDLTSSMKLKDLGVKN